MNGSMDGNNRIFELSAGFHIDLGRIISIRQFFEEDQCWIEIYMDCDQIIVINYPDSSDMTDGYESILKAWESYVNTSNISE